MKKFAIALIALLPLGDARACMDPNEPSFLASLEAATSVFVFRVDSLHVIDRRIEGKINVISGPIEPIKTLKGEPQFQRVAYLDISCGGIQLIPGHYYLAATTQSGPVLAFVRGDNSAIDVSRDFHPLADTDRVKKGLTASVSGHLLGVPMHKNVIGSLPYFNLHGVAPPAPSPPKPKPPTAKRIP